MRLITSPVSLIAALVLFAAAGAQAQYVAIASASS